MLVFAGWSEEEIRIGTRNEVCDLELLDVVANILSNLQFELMRLL